MGIMVYSLLWVMQDLHHQPYFAHARTSKVLTDERSSNASTVRPTINLPLSNLYVPMQGPKAKP